MTPRDASARLSADAESVCRELLPNGRRHGKEWCVGSTQGEAGQSLKVRLTGDKAGKWSDFATGEHGDLLDLWCEVRGIGIAQALIEAKSRMGISEPEFTAHKPRKFKRPDRPKKARRIVETSPVRQHLNGRGITDATIEAFKVAEEPGQAHFSRLPNNPGTIVFPYLRNGELVFTKYVALERVKDKKQVMAEADCEPCLFGWQAVPANARAIAITEGEIDAMTLHQFGIYALSIPFGGGKGEKQRWIEYEFPHLERFDEIFLCLDQDDEGKAAALEIIERLGRHRCRVVKLPHKDANECLQQGVTMEALAACFVQARTMDPEELKNARDYVDDVIAEFYPSDDMPCGMLLPWQKAGGSIAFRKAEVTVWTGINGHGKSQLLGHALIHGMNWSERCCIASMEMPARRTLHRMVRQITGLAQPSIPFIRAAHDWLGDKLWLFAVVGTAKADRIIEVFRYARQRYGITQFVVDSLAKCGIPEDDYNGQKAFVERLVDFCHEHECHVHLVAHARKGQDENQAPGKLDVKGTGALTDMVDNVVTVWRNKRKEKMLEDTTDLSETPEETAARPDAALIVSKQRNGEWEGQINLWFDRDSLQYLGQPHHTPRPYIEFSSATEASA